MKPIKSNAGVIGINNSFEIAQLLTKKEPRRSEWFIEKSLSFAGIFSILIIALIFIFLFKEAVLFFRTASPLDLIGKWQYDEYEGKTVFKIMWQAVSEVPKYSLIPLMLGSFLVALPGTIIASFFGIGSAIYLSEIAPLRIRETLKPTLELLAGIPSVVVGFFMLAVAATLIQNVFHTKFRLNAFVGAVGVALCTFPIVVTLAEDALRAVPKELRDASYALGATKWQTIFGTVIPAAISGISAAILLGFGRALGETMIVAIAAGMQPNFTWNPTEPAQTITAYIVQVSLGDLPHGSIGYQTIFVCGLSLFLLTFVFNIFGHFLKKRYREVY